MNTTTTSEKPASIAMSYSEFLIHHDNAYHKLLVAEGALARGEREIVRAVCRQALSDVAQIQRGCASCVEEGNRPTVEILYRYCEKRISDCVRNPHEIPLKCAKDMLLRMIATQSKPLSKWKKQGHIAA